jgi:2',3'-cyclic-nucleotide 2'-phosphodiesterase (5'-nucleotidase family)
MSANRFTFFFILILFTCKPCLAESEANFAIQAKPGKDRVVTLLFTNDVESAYDPIPAFWLDDVAMIGGIAEMTTLIQELREQQPNVFLFDSGDIFTGALAKLTEGRLAFELMITMGYDAMAIGNHEFEYGHEVFAWQKNRVPFPVLGANFFYRDTDHPFAQAHAIIERNGIRIGVIGIMGQDAVSAIIPSFIAPLDVRDPAAAVKKSVDELRDEVDLIVLLTHQGKTAPMQTDAESDPRLQRDIDADIALAGAVEGIDVLFAGHADAGTPEPVVHPDTGTLIMQTYGQATHLGYLQLALDGETGNITRYDGKLIPVDPSRWGPDQEIAGKLAEYRSMYPEIMATVGKTGARMNRRYIEESDVGNLFADIFVEASGADIGFIHGGSLRKDLPAGDVRVVDLLDTYPFVDDVIIKQMNGDQIRRALEQSLTFERGLLQFSGLELTYDLQRPQTKRIVSLSREGKPVMPDDQFTIAAPGFLSEGGDLYSSFPESVAVGNIGKVSEVVIQYFRDQEVVKVPERGRQMDVTARENEQN